MQCVGIDGAGSGWLAVWEASDGLQFAGYPTVEVVAVHYATSMCWA